MISGVYMKLGSLGEYVVIDIKRNIENNTSNIPASSVNLFLTKLLVFTSICELIFFQITQITLYHLLIIVKINL